MEQLTSLVGAPKEKVGGVSIVHNKLTSLEGAPKEVGEISCSHNKLTYLVGAPKYVGGNFIVHITN